MTAQDARQMEPGLKKITPYWYPYRTNAKERWLGREMLELVSTEFRDRSVEYYRYALEAGVISVNGKPAQGDTIVRNGDLIECVRVHQWLSRNPSLTSRRNIVHRHEPPVSSRPVKIIHVDKEKEFIVIDKPGSIPVHATGRYFKNSLVEILRSDHGIQNHIVAVNRLDRLTSGLMIIATSSARARVLCEEFVNRAIQKEYIARCRGRFPECVRLSNPSKRLTSTPANVRYACREEIVVDQPMLTVDRQMGLNIVHPDGKPAKTIFKRLFYDPGSDSSVLHCKPVTGRSHQIRVHLQYLGYPIANDPVYSDKKVWGSNLGRGGLDMVAGTQSYPEGDSAVESASKAAPGMSVAGSDGPFNAQVVQDMGVLASVTLSAEAVNLIASMRNNNPPASMRPQGTLIPGTPVPLEQGGSGGVGLTDNTSTPQALVDALAAPYSSSATPEARLSSATSDQAPPKALPRETGEDIGTASPVPLTREATGVIQRLRNMKDENEDWSRWRDVIFRAKKALMPPLHDDSGPAPDPSTPFEPAVHVTPDGRETLYCPECYLPLHADPKPEQLYIFLHAKRYSTDEWSFETDMPEWAIPNYQW
ncbi:pseudouridine synthase [Auriculariales sp. MPI-PUGE-AT-0066]|nr:pseudouridine synthase [Auriculariales sp. MPI-PUGE-AT-0066]